MEGFDQKSLERIVSQKAMQMGSSWQCQRCVVGFLCGIGMTSLFLAALTSIGTFGISFAAINSLNSSSYQSSSSSSSSPDIRTECNLQPKITQKIFDSTRSKETSIDEKASSLYSAWSSLLTRSPLKADDNIPKAPHLEDCKLRHRQNERVDKRNGTANFPTWTSWKGDLNTFRAATESESFASFELEAASSGAYPPWISGSDEENYPLTRKVQRDLWLHQHPLDCRDPSVRFLVADWERDPGYGIGAQIAGMTGLFAIAINEKRVLVTNYYNRADHDTCHGSSRSSWSCYFFPETSQECRDRALELVASEDAWKQGIVTGKQSYRSREMWSGPTPRIWGRPWSFLQPTTEVNGTLIASHHKMDRRWWRAQAVRYLMRFRSEYTCELLNVARHSAFGKEAAVMVAGSFSGESSKEFTNDQSHEIENFVWSNREAWTPRPLLSMHVRMGDKACEMDIVGFEKYMLLADRVRRRFPELNSVWLSTEMQEVIDKTREYTNWRFFYTDVRRQERNASMAVYEASLGRETSTNYPIVNFLMATEADYFVGALGSTWCYLIDGMRNTGGKVMAGYLSVNKDRFW